MDDFAMCQAMCWGLYLLYGAVRGREGVMKRGEEYTSREEYELRIRFS